MITMLRNRTPWLAALGAVATSGLCLAAPTWSVTLHGEGGGMSPSRAIVESRDGYVIGASMWSPETDADVSLIRIDESGVVWAVAYGTEASEQLSSLSGVPGGGFVLGGLRLVAGESRAWVLRLDPDGTVRWQKSYGGAHRVGLSTVRPTVDDGFLLAGQVFSTELRGWLAQLHRDGTIAWQRAFAGLGMTGLTDVVPLEDGGAIVVATMAMPGRRQDLWLQRLRSDGSIVWQRSYGGEGDEVALSAAPATDGGVVIAGRSTSAPTPCTPITLRVLVVKVTGDGALEWAETLAGERFLNATSVREGARGHVVIAGNDGSVAGRMWAAEIDSGVVVWSKSYRRTTLGPGIRPTLDGGFLLTSNTFREGTMSWLLKIDDDGAFPGLSEDIPVAVEETTLVVRESDAVALDTGFPSQDTFATAREVAVVARSDLPPTSDGVLHAVRATAVGRPRPNPCDDERSREMLAAHARTESIPGNPRSTAVMAGDPARRSATRSTPVLRAITKTRLAWRPHADVYLVKGPLALVRTYEVSAIAMLVRATSVDIAADEPAPATGVYYLVREVGGGSWQTRPGRERERDAALP